jgi:3-hydroxybutyryl-CoA dehydrogenase
MTHEIRTVGVVGAGQMGSGIAQVAAVAGYKVLLHDVSRDRMNAAIAGIDANLARAVGAGKLTEAERAAAMARIGTAETYAGFSDADLVVEAAVEDEAVKRGLLRDISKALKPDALLATNTSSISITRLAAATDRPEKFIGIHFMNPVPKMELVEIIRGIATADATFEAAMALTARLNKTPIRAEDFPAFIVNRVLVPMINEAIYALHEGVGTVDAIDTAMRLGAHHPMGPLQLADFIGLDTCLSIMQVLHEGLADSKYRPCPLLVKYVEAGWLGKKTGRGFYNYSGAKPVPTR